MMFSRGLGNFGMHYSGFGSANSGLWLALAIVFVAALVVAIVLSSKKTHSSSEDAEEALLLRYVNGELTEEEYQKMSEVIGM